MHSACQEWIAEDRRSGTPLPTSRPPFGKRLQWNRWLELLPLPASCLVRWRKRHSWNRSVQFVHMMFADVCCFDWEWVVQVKWNGWALFCSPTASHMMRAAEESQSWLMTPCGQHGLVCCVVPMVPRRQLLVLRACNKSWQDKAWPSFSSP